MSWRSLEDGKLQVGSRFVYFHHDYPAEIVKMVQAIQCYQENTQIRGIPFQTPFDNVRIHWESGAGTYKSATVVYSDLQPTEAPSPPEDEHGAQTRLHELLSSRQSTAAQP